MFPEPTNRSTAFRTLARNPRALAVLAWRPSTDNELEQELEQSPRNWPRRPLRRPTVVGRVPSMRVHSLRHRATSSGHAMPRITDGTRGGHNDATPEGNAVQPSPNSCSSTCWRVEVLPGASRRNRYERSLRLDPRSGGFVHEDRRLFLAEVLTRPRRARPGPRRRLGADTGHAKACSRDRQRAAHAMLRGPGAHRGGRVFSGHREPAPDPRRARPLPNEDNDVRSEVRGLRTIAHRSCASASTGRRTPEVDPSRISDGSGMRFRGCRPNPAVAEARRRYRCGSSTTERPAGF